MVDFKRLSKINQADEEEKAEGKKKDVKNCTSLEQSKELLSLGLSAKTSDMMWGYFYNGKNLCVPQIRPFLDMRGEIPKGYVPAWSLTKLLDLLPDVIREGDVFYTFSLTKNVIEYIDHEGKALYSTGGWNFVDAAVEMFKKIGV